LIEIEGPIHNSIKKSKATVHLNNFERFIVDFREIVVILKFIDNEFL
jgi:hypothetical protein